MAFSDSVIEEAFARAGGVCECERKEHNHVPTISVKDGGFVRSLRCTRKLDKLKRGDREGAGGWEAHHVSSNGEDVLSNCEILCWPCHKKTASFGKTAEA